MAVLLRPGNPGGFSAQDMALAAGSLKLELQTIDVSDETEFDRAFSRLAKGRVDAVTVHDDPFFSSAHRLRMIAEAAIKARLVAIGNDGLAKAGGLIGYGVNFNELWQRASVFGDKILKGAKPADIPVEQPTKFELVINLRSSTGYGRTGVKRFLHDRAVLRSRGLFGTVSRGGWRPRDEAVSTTNP